jgi:Cys-tRNA(Pro)/Cys-tRNA(Cys) deacylase
MPKPEHTHNNVTRMLDARHIRYRAYELPAERIGALEAATLMNVPAEKVFKTIVVTRMVKGKPILAMVPGPREVDLKALAKVVGEKKLALATQRQAEELTGLQVGGISALALLNRGFQMVMDASAEALGEIYISGGQRGLDICLAVKDLVQLTNCKVTQISS